MPMARLSDGACRGKVAFGVVLNLDGFFFLIILSLIHISLQQRGHAARRGQAADRSAEASTRSPRLAFGTVTRCV